MSLLRKIVHYLTLKVDNFRLALAYIDALPQLTALGAVIGICTGLTIVLFRFCINTPLHLWLPDHPENFESLATEIRVALIFGGCFALTILFYLTDKKNHETSIAHVLERLHNHQGKLPIKNWLVQFLGAIVALITGQSVGREGPVVHLGAGAASQLGQWLKLPNNSMHTLIGCGVAAAISASFNTPMAGVIFAMEVILLEYTIVGFVPVILASVIGAAISQAVFGSEVSFKAASSSISSLSELPYMIAFGLVIALCASLYIKLNIATLKWAHLPIAVKFLIAATLTAGVACYVPEIMGLGYDTANLALQGKIAFTALITIAAAKLFVTPIVVALGIPGGLIGPLLIIGACVGGALGVMAKLLYPNLEISIEIYVILGMTGMMAATLNAPLAALVAVLELSYNPHMIFPAMLVIVASCLCTRQFFGLKGIFIEQLNCKGRDLSTGHANRALQSAGVTSVMDKRLRTTTTIVDYDQAKALLSSNPMWIIIEKDEEKTAMRAADLAAYLKDAPEEVLSLDQQIDLDEIPARRNKLVAIHETATLLEALRAFSASGAQGLYVASRRTPLKSDVAGIVSKASIENYYQPEEFKHVVDVD